MRFHVHKRRGHTTPDHGFNLRSMGFHMVLVGLVLFLGALALKYSGLDISLWWVVGIVFVGLHVGIAFLGIGAVLRWRAARKERVRAQDRH